MPFDSPRWKPPVTDAELGRLGTEFDAGPQPVVNGVLWTESHKFSDGDRYRLAVQQRNRNAWVVADGRSVLSIDGDWKFESMPSERRDQFIRETRFGTPIDALSVAAAYRNRLTDWVSRVGNPDVVILCGVSNGQQSFESSPEHCLFVAQAIATRAHSNQYRKYGGENPRPYICHPEAVAAEARAWFESRVSPEQVDMWEAVGWLHDAVEDGPEWIADKIHQFNGGVYKNVILLTNTSKSHPELNRAARKKLDREHLAQAPWEIKAIKLIDRRLNLMDLDHPDSPVDFRRLYACESKELIAALVTPATTRLAEEAIALCEVMT